MPFGIAEVLTDVGRALISDRIRTVPATYGPPKFLGIGVGATAAARTAAHGDTALSTPVESHVSGTESVQTTSVAGDTYRVTATMPITADRAIDEYGLFDSNSSMFVSGTQAVINLKNGDSITYVVDTQQA